MGKRSRRKGKRAEYYIRDYLRKVLQVEVERVPNSGNHKKFCCDLIVDDKWRVEVKYRTKGFDLPYPCFDGKLYSFTLKSLVEQRLEITTCKFPSLVYEWIGNCDVLVVKFAWKEPVFFAKEEFYRWILGFLLEKKKSGDKS